MLVCNYIVKKLDGDYAHLIVVDDEGHLASDDMKLVARALLPLDIEEGSILHYKLMEYTLIK